MSPGKVISIIAIASVLLIGVFPSVSIAQDSNSARLLNPWGHPRRPEGIGVIQEMKVGDKKRRIQIAEDALFKMFNDLNESDTFDITCTPTRTYNPRINRQICEPAYLSQLRAQQQTLNSFEYSNPDSGVTPLPNKSDNFNQLTGSLAIEAAEKYQALQNQMRRIAMESPEFREAIELVGRLRRENKPN